MSSSSHISQIDFNNIIDTLPIVVWRASSDGGLTFISKQWELIFGNPIAESLGNGWGKFVHPDDQEHASRLWAESLKHGTNYETEFRVEHKTKGYTWILVRAIPNHDINGNVTSWNGSNTDINEQKLAEERFRTLADNIPNLAWMANAEGWIYWYNKKWYEYTGTIPEQMEGWGWQSVHHPIELPHVLEKWQSSIKSGEQFEMVFPLKGADGNFRQFLTRIVPIKDANNNIQQWFGTNTDITNQLLNEKTIKENEAHLQLLRDTVPAMIFYLDEEQRYKSCNIVFMDWFKTTSDEVIGKTVREFIGEAAYQSAEPYLKEAYKGKQTRYEIKAPTRIGTDKWLDIVYTPHINNEGLVIGVIVHAMDITQSKQTELSLRNSELFSRDIIYNSPIAKIVYTGEDMIVSVVNENMLELMGRDNSIVGKSFKEVVPELAGSLIEEQMKTVFRTGEMHSQAEELVSIMRYGKPYTGYYNYIYKALRNVSGEIYGILATATEVSEQVKARKKIEESEGKLRGLISASPIGICVVSGDPIIVDEVNERFLFISGKTREQFDEAPFWEVLSEVAFEFKPILEQVFKTGKKYTTEENEMVLLRDGISENIFLTFEYIPVFDKKNVVTKVMIMAIEVTHQVETRKLIETAVIERTKELDESNLNLKRSNAELEQFAYIASHDLQEPIRKISIFTQMLENSIPNINDKSKDFISKIYNSTDRMTNLIRDVLAFSKISQDENSFESTELSSVIKSVETDFDLLINQKQATIIYSELPILHAIPSQMNQLFNNLMSNALKFSIPTVHPIIKISSSIAKSDILSNHPQLDRNKKYHHIIFADNGIGFDQEHADKIFKIFQRLHAKTEFEGTGIGLSICRKIVHTHQGHISASIGENGGAVFNILLPA